MDKIFRRVTMSDGKKQEQKKKKNRKRNVTMNFRVSEKEKKLIESRIALTGLPKSKYFIESCLYQNVMIKGNIRVFDEIRKQVKEIAEAINRNPNLEGLEDCRLESLRMILEMLENLYGKE
ncbi:MAG: hypothetical protein MJ087_03400 [Lachnospiraceae bacterium]|nr:hypothetical protein [Lachnospiraceae bacterium]